MFCGSRGLLETCLGDLGGLLWIHGGLYGLLRVLWCGFGCPLGPFEGAWEALGAHLGVFGWLVPVLFGACGGKRETVKSGV